MKAHFSAGLLFLSAAIICGCSSRHIGPVYHAGDEQPPLFLTGPIAPVLTNLNGFSAQVTSTKLAPDGESKTSAGQLLGREGRLIYQPTLAIKGKRARAEGGLYFIWDENRHSGYVLSEALQGYAPVDPESHAQGALNLANTGIREEANGHPCHRWEGMMDLSNGRKARLTVWQADDAGHFPARIQAVDESGKMTVNLTEFRQEAPGQNLFRPPDGFTGYATAVALMNELIVRDASLAKKYGNGDFEEPAAINNNGWRQQQPGMR